MPMNNPCMFRCFPMQTLTSYSVMHVNLAAQVLSKTMAVALRKLSPSDSEATATFCEMIDSFSDCLNVRSLE